MVATGWKVRIWASTNLFFSLRTDFLRTEGEVEELTHCSFLRWTQVDQILWFLALVSKVCVCVCCFCTVVFFGSDQVGGKLQHGADQVCRSLHGIVHKPHRVWGDPGQAPWCGRRHKHIWLFSSLPAPIIRLQHNFWSSFLKAWVRFSEKLGVKLVGETNTEMVLDSVKEKKKIIRMPV